MLIKVYEYKKCSTCQKALKYLDSKGIKYECLPIFEQAPSIAELKNMLAYLKKEGASFKSLFNTSGQQYRELHLSEKIKAGMSEEEAIKLLSQNGRLVKRPFLLTPKGGAVGFKPNSWKHLL